MEAVVAVSPRPQDPARPVICLDETRRHVLAAVRPPLPSAPGRPARQDPEDGRAGGGTLLLVTEPLRGWRPGRVSDQRTHLDWAHCVTDRVDVHSPAAERLVLGMDQLNTHTPASLDEAFAPAAAKRLADKLEMPYTPTHGSWLNMAELELSILHRQCLDRRLADPPTLTSEVVAWVTERTSATQTIDWRFTTADARSKLKHRYPIFYE
jgi:hypothetical protein